MAVFETSNERQLREALPPNKLTGFCDHCQEWFKFDSATSDGKCPDCGGNHSNRIGFQLTTQRSFDPAAKKLTKSALKKMTGRG